MKSLRSLDAAERTSLIFDIFMNQKEDYRSFSVSLRRRGYDISKRSFFYYKKQYLAIRDEVTGSSESKTEKPLTKKEQASRELYRKFSLLCIEKDLCALEALEVAFGDICKKHALSKTPKVLFAECLNDFINKTV